MLACPQNEKPGGFSEDGFARDSNALERLTRYCARPPFSSGRLGQLDEHTVAYNLPRPTQDGRTCLLIPSQLCKPRYITVSFW
jgi:hypothetical protein